MAGASIVRAWGFILTLLLACPAFAEPGPATRTSTAPIQINFDESFVHAGPEDISVQSRGMQKPVFGEWWFWSIVGVAMSAVVVTGAVLSSGGTFVPDGELGNSNTSEWGRF